MDGCLLGGISETAERIQITFSEYVELSNKNTWVTYFYYARTWSRAKASLFLNKNKTDFDLTLTPQGTV